MKSTILFFLSVVLSMGAFAHDPKEHAKEGAAPDCQAMARMAEGDMDHDKMSHDNMGHEKMTKPDVDDPVMQAMMVKCKRDMKMDDESEEHKGHH